MGTLGSCILSKNTLVNGIVAQLVRKLETGELKQGDKLPSIIELSELYGVSRNSMREALSVLSAMGYITAKSGEGSYVSAPAFWSIQLPFRFLTAQGELSGEDFRRMMRLMEAEVFRALSPAALGKLEAVPLSSFWESAFSLAGNGVAALFYQICLAAAGEEEESFTQAVRDALPSSEEALRIIAGC